MAVLLSSDIDNPLLSLSLGWVKNIWVICTYVQQKSNLITKPQKLLDIVYRVVAITPNILPAVVWPQSAILHIESLKCATIFLFLFI